MTMAYWSVLVAAVLPLLCAGVAKWGMLGVPRRAGGYDNHDPRHWLARQQGWRRRANAAQANSFEALPLFVGAIIIAHQMHAPQVRIDVLAVVFIVLRLIYVLMYIADAATIRSVVWAGAWLVNIAIFFAGVRW